MGAIGGALGAAQQLAQQLALVSVKSIYGHTEGAAGDALDLGKSQELQAEVDGSQKP